jgi:hypothetical protein
MVDIHQGEAEAGKASPRGGVLAVAAVLTGSGGVALPGIARLGRRDQPGSTRAGEIPPGPSGSREVRRLQVAGHETAWYEVDQPHRLLQYFNGVEKWVLQGIL